MAVRHRLGMVRRSTGQPKLERVRPEDDPVAGETWTDLPEWGFRVSSIGRLASRRSGFLLKPSINSTGALYITSLVNGTRRTILVDTLLYAAAGQVRERRRHGAWRKAEDQALLRARTLAEAVSVLDRTEIAVKARAKRLKKRFERALRSEPGVVRGSVPYGQPDWEAARKVVPEWYPPHVREDLIQDIVVLRLEGFAGSIAEAFAVARSRHNKTFNTWKERSLFEPLPGNSGKTLIDVLPA